MMSLNDKETTAMTSVLRMTTSVFTCEGEGEEEDSYRLTDSFHYYLATVKSGERYKEAVSRNSPIGVTGKEDPKIPKRIITLNDVAQFVESVKQSPKLLDPELTSLIVKSSKCPGFPKVTKEVFLNFVESDSVKLDNDLRQSLEREFKITYSDMISRLQAVCLKLREEMKNRK